MEGTPIDHTPEQQSLEALRASAKQAIFAMLSYYAYDISINGQLVDPTELDAALLNDTEEAFNDQHMRQYIVEAAGALVKLEQAYRGDPGTQNR